MWGVFKDAPRVSAARTVGSWHNARLVLMFRKLGVTLIERGTNELIKYVMRSWKL